MEHDKTGFEASPEGPILCINNCGFFGSAATMNMCSKCHKDMILKQQAKLLATSSIENIVNGSTSSSIPTNQPGFDVQVVSIESKVLSLPSPTTQEGLSSVETAEDEVKLGNGGPKRCFTCKKRVGLTGFLCKCENMFCGSHRYSDKHECPFDYRVAGQNAIARANPVVKADKLDKI